MLRPLSQLLQWLNSNIKKINWSKWWWSSYITSLVLVIFAVIFLFIAVAIWDRSEFFSNFLSGLSAETIGILIAFWIVDIWFRNKRKREWDPVSDDAMKLIKSEIQGLFYDINFLTDDPTISHWSTIDDPNTLNRLYKEKLAEKQSRPEIKIPHSIRDAIKEGNWHSLFYLRKENINSLELKYSKYLEPNIIKPLITVQVILSKIDMHIKLFEKRRLDDDAFFEDMEKLFKLLICHIYTIDKDIDIFEGV